MADFSRLLGVALACIGAVAVVVGIDLMGSLSWGRSMAEFGAFVWYFLWLCFFVPGLIASLPVLLVMLFVRRTRRGLGTLAVVYGSLAVASFLGLQIVTAQRERSMHALAIRTDPVIAAVTRFEHDHGAPPTALADLVPGYLPRIPDTGFGFAPDLRYERFDSTGTTRRRIWYELGPTDSTADTRSGLVNWVGPEGKAILYLEVNAKGRILVSRLGRMPSATRQVPFDPQGWRVVPEARLAMAVAVHDSLGRLASLQQAIGMLGAPSGEQELPMPRWALRMKLAGEFAREELAYTPDDVIPLGDYFERKDRYGRWRHYTDDSD